MMDKQEEANSPPHDSISTVGVTVKDYPPSEVYSSEPPPAYVRRRATGVQIARIGAVTLVAVSLILGLSMLASAYITATASCAQYYQDYPPPQQQQEVEDRPSFQHLVDPLDPQESRHPVQQPSEGPKERQQPPALDQKRAEEERPAAKNGGVEEAGRSDGKRDGEKVEEEEEEEEEPVVADGEGDAEGDDDSIVILAERQEDADRRPIQIRLPLQLHLDDLAAPTFGRDQRSRMNCVVEKRRSEEVTDQRPKTVNLPFGVNLTTDPSYEHITGERMAIFCESARHTPVEEEIRPVMVPIAVDRAVPVPVPVPVPVAMPLHHQQQMQQQMQQMQQQRIYSQPDPFSVEYLRLRQQEEQQRQLQMRLRHMQPPPSPARLEPPAAVHDFLPPPLLQQQLMRLRQLQHLQQLQQMQRMHPPPPPPPPPSHHANHPQIVVESGRQVVDEVVPIQVIGEEHVIPIFQVDGRRAAEEVEEQQRQQQQLQLQQQQQQHQQYQRLDNEDEERVQPRAMPVQLIPLHLIQQQQQQQQQQQLHHQQQQQQQQQQLQLQELDDQQQPVVQTGRPHYVQPRSVRSVDNALLHRREKRVRRCSCNCAC